MVHISLAIGGLPDQHIVLRAGGLYWVTVDHSADAKLLARQFLENIPESVPATLIASTGYAQGLVNDMAPDRGPVPPLQARSCWCCLPTVGLRPPQRSNCNVGSSACVPGCWSATPHCW